MFLHIAFVLGSHRNIPLEPIIDAVYVLVAVDYKDIVNDRYFGGFSDGIAAPFRCLGKGRYDGR